MAVGGKETDLQVTIDGPYSTAYLRSDSVRPIICIGGGSGLAPMVSILRGISQRKSDKTKPVLYYGARQEKDVVDQEYLATIPGFNPENQYIPIVSEPEESDTWAGATGLVHEFLKSHLKASGRVLLAINGMWYDVTDFMSEHPGPWSQVGHKPLGSNLVGYA